jgi:hypothetical protein
MVAQRGAASARIVRSTSWPFSLSRQAFASPRL